MSTLDNVALEIVEVGPRDGYQGIGPFIPTETKIRLLEQLAAAGLRRIEIGSFVSSSALPQMRDTPEVLAASARLPGLSSQVLVPSERRGREAVEAGARQLVFVLSVSEAHNRSNVRRHPLESVVEYERLLAAIPADVAIRLDIATAFDCPFTGRVPEAATLDLLDRLVPLREDAEICLCDTTGRVAPDHVESLFAACMARFPQVTAWAFHGHDTYGLGLANINAAFRRGWEDARSLPAQPAMSRPRMSSGCSSGWALPRALISTRLFPSRVMRQRCLEQRLVDEFVMHC
jgi:hydroxymethylglutaryl-CoA lyase